MEDLVVDSKYGRRPLTEVAPMYPTIEQKQLMQDPFLGQYRPHTEGNFHSHLRQNFSHPIQDYVPGYPQPAPYAYGHRFGLVPEGLSYYHQPLGGDHNVPNFRHNPVPIYTDPWGSPVQPGQGIYDRHLATSHGYPMVSGSLQPQFYNHQHGHVRNPSDHLPVYGHPNPLHSMYEQQTNIRSGQPEQAGYLNPNMHSLYVSNQYDRIVNTKPKSAHYFYGPDGGLLSGPGEFYKNLDPPQNRVSQSEPVLNHYPEDRGQVNEMKSSGDFLVEVVLKYGKLRNVTVKNSAPDFKTLPEFLVDELEKNYCRIPETHVVLVAVNGSYSIYASPCTRSDIHTPSSRVPTERDRPQPYIRHNSTQ